VNCRISCTRLSYLALLDAPLRADGLEDGDIRSSVVPFICFFSFYSEGCRRSLVGLPDITAHGTLIPPYALVACSSRSLPNLIKPGILLTSKRSFPQSRSGTIPPLSIHPLSLFLFRTPVSGQGSHLRLSRSQHLHTRFSFQLIYPLPDPLLVLPGPKAAIDFRFPTPFSHQRVAGIHSLLLSLSLASSLYLRKSVRNLKQLTASVPSRGWFVLPVLSLRLSRFHRSPLSPVGISSPRNSPLSQYSPLPQVI